VGVYGVIIANISRLLMLADKYTEERKEKMNSLQQYMKHYNIPSSLQRQVFSFYNHILNKNITHEDTKIINDLPQALQKELNIYTKIKLIKNVHIFKECSTPCLKMIAQKLEQTFHSPNEYIIRKGDVGEEMFIIGHGSVQVTAGEKTLAELKEGQFFGEIALIEDTIRNADVQSKAYCDLYTFKKEDFMAVIEKYPHLGEKFEEIHQKRIQERSVENIQKAA
ncbi:MAG: cyclic nucleotide-binding domain-containing protein, partial [Halobacteriovoraceae bacterium]|nr:cyclic nucleotide-binding domain-containing protein [Halobacteriovoraceae bacterium]